MRSLRGSVSVSRLFYLISAAVVLAATTGVAFADTATISFEPPTYVLGSVHAQNGWSSLGSIGSGCAVYDHAVAGSAGFAAFGTQSLRMSNAVTSGCFGDQTFSLSLVDEAGETDAEGDGMSGGTRQNHFEAEWQFGSTVPGSEQTGLSVVASPDRGDGARMSWVQMTDTPAGLEVNFYDYQDIAPFGTDADPTLGCNTEDDFFFTNLASGLDRTQTHSIKIVMDLLDGPGNDIVEVWVDGTLRHVGGSWEDYFRYCEVNPTRTVDSLLLRTGGTAAPATAGNGFVIDSLRLQSGPAFPCYKECVKELKEQCKGLKGKDKKACEDDAKAQCELIFPLKDKSPKCPKK